MEKKIETRAITKLSFGCLKYQVETLEEGENYFFEASLERHNFNAPIPETLKASTLYSCFISKSGDITLTFDILPGVPISRHLTLFNLLFSFIKRGQLSLEGA